MGLIKPPLWRLEASLQEANLAPREGPFAHVCSPSSPSRRCSPLRARTTKLLQRLRAQAGEAAAPQSPRVSAATAAARPNDDADLNRVHLTGTLGCEPLLYDVGDHPVAALALACQRHWRTPAGIWNVETTWFNLSAADELAEQCGRQLHRGDRVYVEGSLCLWAEVRGPHSYGCHTVAIDRIVLLAASHCNGDGP
jgi:hypothetical protein